MTGWLRRQWREGDTYLWVCAFIIVVALAGIVLALTVPVTP